MNGAARAKLLFCLLDQDVFVAVAALDVALDCKTVRMFAYSSTRQQPNGRVRLAQFALKTLTPRFTDFFTVLQSIAA